MTTVEEWQGAFDASQGKVKELWQKLEAAEAEIARLERIYECARQFLRFNGVDKDRTRKAIDALDGAVEAVKTARENDENAPKEESTHTVLHELKGQA